MPVSVGPRTHWIDAAAARVDELSVRQWDVFVALAEGLSTREIADRLTISEHTVKLHTTHILRILKLNSRLQAGLVAYACLAGCLCGRCLCGCASCPPIRKSTSQRSSCGSPDV
ncbi:MAG: response regulator transcription factor [Pseudonocardiaceae bacterium]